MDKGKVILTKGKISGRIVETKIEYKKLPVRPKPKK